MDPSNEYLLEAGKAAPPVAVSSIMVAGLSLQEWVLIVTLLYTVLQIGVLAYKFINRKNRGR